jgi:hypothetical protein
MDHGYIKRNCPICCSAESKIEISSTRRAENLSFEELKPFWEGFFKEKVFFSYYRCKSCKILYCREYFNETQLAILYGSLAPNMNLVPIDSLRKTQKGYFNALDRYGLKGGDYMEIGPDIGLFTETVLSHDGFDTYWLFEPNMNVIPDLDALMAYRKHVFVHDLFDFSSVPDNSVGVSVMIQVLDHLLDPLATLRAMRLKLVTGGRLAIVTHDESSFLRHISGKTWPPFCLQHPQIYNPHTMETLLIKAGFDNLKIERTKNYFPVSFLLKHLLWTLKLEVKKVPQLGGIELGLRMGNMISMTSA